MKRTLIFRFRDVLPEVSFSHFYISQPKNSYNATLILSFLFNNLD